MGNTYHLTSFCFFFSVFYLECNNEETNRQIPSVGFAEHDNAIKDKKDSAFFLCFFFLIKAE